MPFDATKYEALKQVALGNLNSIPASKSNDPRSFIEAASNWFGQWWKMRADWSEIKSGYCALVLDHTFGTPQLPEKFSEKILFRDAPDSLLGGSIYVSDYSLTRVYKDAGEHKEVTSIYRQLKKLQLDAAPCVLFDPETGVVLYAEHGLDGDVISTKLGNYDGTLNETAIGQLMTEFYETTLRYPETFPHAWWKKEKFIPTFFAEKLYQNLLFVHLRATTQKTWVIVREDQTNAGRTDLTINGLNPAVVFVIEIKVLKSFFYEALGKPVKPFCEQENETWANSGIDQVLEYKTAKQANQAFLVLYDMRQAHGTITSVSTRCASTGVTLFQYPIFNASARDILAAKLKQSAIP